ncbi:MAG: hypothetical protein DCC49_01575 [Acidobacteria bacterium]|nr:MAG: hypothetical protein DCC49_01575 [Acidobacteriota bacterium]
MIAGGSTSHVSNYYCPMPTTDYAAQTIVAGEVTVTPVARITVNEFSTDNVGAFKVQARPHHIEIVDGNGERSTVEIVDEQARILGYIKTVVLACTILSLFIRGVRAMKKRGSK